MDKWNAVNDKKKKIKTRKISPQHVISKKHESKKSYKRSNQKKETNKLVTEETWEYLFKMVKS